MNEKELFDKWSDCIEAKAAAEAALQAVMTRAVAAEAEHAASRADFIAMRDERDELRHKLNAAMKIGRELIAERNEARRQLAEAQALADVISADALTDWIASAQNEIKSLAERIAELEADGPS